MAVDIQNRELALPPGVFAFMQDCTKGGVKCYTGPIVINQTGQERPVLYESVRRTFQPVDLGQAVVKNILAGEGDYIVLENPPENGMQPKEGSVENAVNLRVGMKVNLPGPCSFSLWPTQSASVIPGHTLRSNQYLVARVYNAEAACKNWNKAVGKNGVTAPEDLAIGKLFIIKGTEVSGFYVPPTGIEVVKGDNNEYVRDAVTLERLEYAILVDEDGNKRYERGPQVVFPEPTEQFLCEGKARKYKSEELTGIQGLHIKVIADYDENGVKYVTGQELFITAKECAIYYPRPEHSLITYGEKRKHYATAIPVGEGRYIMDRDSGEIRTEKGPKMSLPDPRKECFVRRVLTEKDCDLWYPGNPEAKVYNQALRTAAQASSSSNKGGYVTESQLSAYSNSSLEMLDYTAASSARGAVAKMATPDQFIRSQTYTSPRQITLDTKFEGVPSICVWTGYAVMVVDKRGNRRVVQGPDTVLLDYDETLEVLELSTGKPKTTDKLERTVYLRVSNNKVSDIISGVFTRDHVPLTLKLSYRVNFEGAPEKWFDVENYVKFLCDHLRSLLKGAVRKLEIADFYENGAAIIRDIVLGKKGEDGVPRPLQKFEENGMVVSDVEILMIQIEDSNIEKMLAEAQYEVVASNIDLDRAEKNAEVGRRKQEIQREMTVDVFETTKLQSELATEKVGLELKLELSKLDAEMHQAEEAQKITAAKESERDLINKSDLARKQAVADQNLTIISAQTELKLKELKAEVDAVVSRFNAAQPGFSEAILALSHEDTLVKVAQAASVQTMIGGASLADFLQRMFQGTNLPEMLKRVSIAKSK